MRNRIAVLGMMGVMILMMACGGSSAPPPNTTQPTSVVATAVPATEQAAPTQAAAEVATQAVATEPVATQPAATATTAAPTSAPAASNTLPGGDLTGEQLFAIAKASFMHYPWRMQQSVTTKSNQTISTLIEAESDTRVHTVSEQPIAGKNIQIEIIALDQDSYGKATNAPENILTPLGMKEGQWAKIPANSPLAAYVDLARVAANPLKILEQLGVTNQVTQNKTAFKLVGSENLNGAPTNIYSWQQPSTVDPNAQATYRVWIGTSDGLIHQMMSDSPVGTTKTTLEYDSSLKIQPPL
ncbi:MAG TPA: hypothetical protein VFD70_06485 [Anaerolineae bacterium]|nr:hypothetical protein [Anaerolineae bacterium]